MVPAFRIVSKIDQILSKSSFRASTLNVGSSMERFVQMTVCCLREALERSRLHPFCGKNASVVAWNHSSSLKKKAPRRRSSPSRETHMKYELRAFVGAHVVHGNKGDLAMLASKTSWTTMTTNEH